MKCEQAHNLIHAELDGDITAAQQVALLHHHAAQPGPALGRIAKLVGLFDGDQQCVV